MTTQKQRPLRTGAAPKKAAEAEPETTRDTKVYPLSDRDVAYWCDELQRTPARQRFWTVSRQVEAETLARLEVGWKSADLNYLTAENRYTFPVRAADGTLKDVKRYRPGTGERKNIHTNGHGSPCRLWGADRLAKADPKGGKFVVVVEGEPDGVKGEDLGFLTVSATSGGGSLPTDDDLALFKGWNVVVCLDTDAPGRAGASKWVTALLPIAESVRNVAWPEADGKDLTDWLLAGHERDDFIQLVETTLPIGTTARPVGELVEWAVKVALERNGQRNYTGFLLAQQLRDNCYPQEEAERVLIEEYLPLVTDLKDKPYTEDEARATVASAYANAQRKPSGNLGGRPTVEGTVSVRPPNEVMANARQFLEDVYHHGDFSTLLHSLGEFYSWDGSAYRETADRRMRRSLYAYFDNATFPTKDGVQKFNPAPAKISALVDALTGLAMPDEDVDPPGWIAEPPDGLSPSDQYISVANGLLHVPSRRLLPATPAYFCTEARPFAYDGNAPTPRLWLRFLDELFPDDAEAVSGLQELFGYALSGDTSKQKMFMLVGPKRSGKGTISRVLRALVGHSNIAAPTMRELNGAFGAQGLIGKALAVIPDARVDRASAGAVEVLLAVSGEDALQVNRKNRDQLTLRLGARVVMLTNELPRFSDASAAISSRFIIWQFTQSFLGREDDTLTDKLLAELPGIFNWSLAGLDRLNDRGHFIQHESGKAAAEALENLTSAVLLFLKECCEVTESGRPLYPATPDQVWSLFRNWADDSNLQISSKQVFQTQLRAAVPGLDRVRLRVKPKPGGSGSRSGPRSGPKPRGSGPDARPRVYNKIGFKEPPLEKSGWGR